MSGIVATDHGHVRVLTLNRPERRNALDLPDREELVAALTDAGRAARAVVLTGNGPTFCAGGDITSMSSDPVVGRQRLDAVARLATAVAHGPIPVVTAVEGGAFGLGLALACASDLVVAGRSSRFAASFARIGLAPDTGLSWSLPRRIGPARARALMLTARTVASDEALATGMVDEVVDDGTALGRALELADLVASWSAPMVAATRSILDLDDATLDAVLDAEADAQLGLFGTAEFAEGRTAFLERRRPDFVAVPSLAG